MRFILVILILGLIGCGYEHTTVPGQKPGGGGGPQTGEGGAPGTELSFSNVKAQVFEPYCVACHSNATRNAAGVNLETYAAVAPAAASIRQAVASGFMPRNSTLPEPQKQLLFAWIDAGSPEVGDGGTAPPTNPNPGQPQPPNPPPQNPPGCDDDDDFVAQAKTPMDTTEYYFDQINNEFVFRRNRRGRDKCHD